MFAWRFIRVPEIAQPISLDTAKVLCREHAGGAYLSEILRALVATAIGFCVLALVFALYLHLGRPSRTQIFYFGSLPALALFLAGTFCEVVLGFYLKLVGWSVLVSRCLSILVAAVLCPY